MADSLFDKYGFFHPPWWEMNSRPTVLTPGGRIVVPDINPNCWLGTHGVWEGRSGMPPCDGQLRRCHLIPQQMLKKTSGYRMDQFELFDPRLWVWACGGPMGVSGHHGHLDTSKNLRIPWNDLPEELVAFARRYDLMWWVEKTYRRRAGYRSKSSGGGRYD